MGVESAQGIAAFITNPEFVGSVLAAVIGIGGLIAALRFEGHRLREQLRHTEKVRTDDIKREELAILEWYYARTLQLRSVLFLEAETLCEFKGVLEEEPEDSDDEGHLKYILESVKYQDFATGSLARRPRLLPEAMVEEFSRIGNSRFRAQILNAELNLQSTYNEGALQNYKLQRFIELRLDGHNRLEELEDVLNVWLERRALVLSHLLNMVHALNKANPWNNDFIENLQQSRERSAFLGLKELSDRVIIPDRCQPPEEG